MGKNISRPFGAVGVTTFEEVYGTFMVKGRCQSNECTLYDKHRNQFHYNKDTFWLYSQARTLRGACPVLFRLKKFYRIYHSSKSLISPPFVKILKTKAVFALAIIQ